MNILTIVADSLRYDSYNLAHTPNIDRHFDIVNAGAVATFTYPAHQALFQGFYPNSSMDRPLYNRFHTSLFRWHYVVSRPHVMSISGGSCVPQAMSLLRYRTVCIGGVGWFKKTTSLSTGFEVFQYVKDTGKAIDKLIYNVGRKNFYALINFGVTHRPYVHPRMDFKTSAIASPRSGNKYDSSSNIDLQFKQVSCVEYLDSKLAKLFDFILSLDTPTLVCFMADHGDCFGEDGCYGHAFYHPNVMSVPLGWSYFKNGVSRPVSSLILDEIKDG